MSDEVKNFAVVVLISAVAVAVIAGLAWGINYQDWEAQRLRRTYCVERGGVYITAGMEGCFKLQPVEVEGAIR